MLIIASKHLIFNVLFLDDTIATDRAALLCNSCDLQPKSFFTLPVHDLSQMMGYILRYV